MQTHFLFDVLEGYKPFEQMVQESQKSGAVIAASGMAGGDGAKMRSYVKAGKTICGDELGQVIAQALERGENNACMKCIVAAPTAGSCGVMPAVLLPYQQREGLSDETMVRERPRTASTPLASASEARSPLRVVDGGGGRERIDLGPDARDRLRGGNGGPTVRTSEGRGSAVPRSREGGRGGSRGRNQRRR